VGCGASTRPRIEVGRGWGIERGADDEYTIGLEEPGVDGVTIVLGIARNVAQAALGEELRTWA
jgi:hypothetical protein